MCPASEWESEWMKKAVRMTGSGIGFFFCFSVFFLSISPFTQFIFGFSHNATINGSYELHGRRQHRVCLCMCVAVKRKWRKTNEEEQQQQQKNFCVFFFIHFGSPGLSSIRSLIFFFRRLFSLFIFCVWVCVCVRYYNSSLDLLLDSQVLCGTIYVWTIRAHE